MKIKKIETDRAPRVLGFYSQAVDVSGVIYCSGQIGICPDTEGMVSGGITEQTNQALKNIEEVLQEAGSDLEHVARVELYLKDIKDFSLINEVYGNTFTGKIKPARVTVEVSNLPKDALIEVSCIAYKK